MKLENSTADDVEKLTRWIQADPYHKDCLNPVWWLTGQGFQSFRLDDSVGATMYVRLDKDVEDLLRIHIQFGPESEVSKSRVVKAIIKTLPVIAQFAKTVGMKGLIYRSVSKSLINFLQIKFGFTPVGSDSDYKLPFEVD